MSIFVNPVKFWPPSFLGLAYPILLFINAFFFVFWLLLRKKYLFIPLIAIALTFPLLKNYFSFHLKPPERVSSPPALKVMSYNVRNFDLYNWSRNKASSKEMMELIKNENPDVACFQEFFNADTGKFQNIKELMNICGFSYYHFGKTFTLRKYEQWGIATFSKFPIVEKGNIQFEGRTTNSCIYSDINWHDTIIRVYNIHLQSIHLSDADKKYLEQVADDQDLDIESSQKVLSKLKTGFELRSKQALKVKKQMLLSDHPVILCGDFNDTPASFAYQTLKSGMKDAFLETGWGVGPTLDEVFPFYRIDYILTDPHFTINSYQTICRKYSDHYPLVSRITYTPAISSKEDN